MASPDNVNRSYTEANVTVNLPDEQKSSDRLKILNEKLGLFREITLATLKLEVECTDTLKYCCDVVAETGIAGLQWKKHLTDKVAVTCGDRSGHSVKDSCRLNHLQATDWNKVDGSQKSSETSQGPDQIYVSSLPTKVLLHSEPFDFVYLHSHGNQVTFVDSLFSNVKSGGVVCLLCPNISSQCFRSPKLIQRQFHAHTQKTMYVTEMAARIVIADIVKTAGRHGRAVDILCTLCAENHLMFIVKVKKSSQLAENLVDKCRPILHCLMCEERCVYPSSHCPVEMPYSLLSCDCKSKNPGKTATILGPMWVGSVYNVPFLDQLIQRIKTDFPQSTASTFLALVITEAICDNHINTVPPLTKNMTLPNNKTEEPVAKKLKLSELVHDNSGNESSTNEGNGVNCVKGKEKMTLEKEEHRKYEEMPLFYYHLHQQRHSIVPRSEVMVLKLKKAGFRASRTHFEPHSIRTNATRKQTQVIIEKIKD